MGAVGPHEEDYGRVPHALRPGPDRVERRRATPLVAVSLAVVAFVGLVLGSYLLIVALPGSESGHEAAKYDPESIQESGVEDEHVESQGAGRLAFSDDDPGLDGDAPLSDRLEELQDGYRSMFADGTLWDLIEENQRNTGAYFAFMYLLTDVRGAMAFGASEEDQEYFSKFIRLMETRFLEEEPLGVDVTIDMSDGRTFSYDGETGRADVG